MEAVKDEGVWWQGRSTELNQLHIAVVHLTPDQRNVIIRCSNFKQIRGSPAAGVVIEKDLVSEAISISPPHASMHLKSDSELLTTLAFESPFFKLPVKP